MSDYNRYVKVIRKRTADATEALILSIGAELLDVSPDKLLEMLDKEGGAV